MSKPKKRPVPNQEQPRNLHGCTMEYACMSRNRRHLELHGQEEETVMPPGCEPPPVHADTWRVACISPRRSNTHLRYCLHQRSLGWEMLLVSSGPNTQQVCSILWQWRVGMADTLRRWDTVFATQAIGDSSADHICAASTELPSSTCWLVSPLTDRVDQLIVCRTNKALVAAVSSTRAAQTDCKRRHLLQDKPMKHRLAKICTGQPLICWQR